MSLKYPDYWETDTSGDALYNGSDGFFQIYSTTMAAPTAKAEYDLLLESNIKGAEKLGTPPQYGEDPTLKILEIDGQPACLILPSSDQAETYRGISMLVVEYPSSLKPKSLLLFSADRNHMPAFIFTLKFL